MYLHLAIFLQLVVDRILCHCKLFFQGEALAKNALASAKALLDALNNPTFKLNLLFLPYLLELVTKINLEFQSENAKLPFLSERMTTIYTTLLKAFVKKELIDSNSDNLSKINFLDILIIIKT